MGLRLYGHSLLHIESSGSRGILEELLKRSRLQGFGGGYRLIDDKEGCPRTGALVWGVGRGRPMTWRLWSLGPG